MDKLTKKISAQIVNSSETVDFMKDILIKNCIPFTSKDSPKQLAVKVYKLYTDVNKDIKTFDPQSPMYLKACENKFFNHVVSQGSDLNTAVLGFDIKGALKGIANVALDTVSTMPLMGGVSGLVKTGLNNMGSDTEKTKTGSSLMYSRESLVNYLNLNPDVLKEALKTNDAFLFAQNHWINHGQKEGRKGSPNEFTAQNFGSDKTGLGKVLDAAGNVISEYKASEKNKEIVNMLPVILGGVLVITLVSYFVFKKK